MQINQATFSIRDMKDKNCYLISPLHYSSIKQNIRIHLRRCLPIDPVLLLENPLLPRPHHEAEAPARQFPGRRQLDLSFLLRLSDHPADFRV